MDNNAKGNNSEVNAHYANLTNAQIEEIRTFEKNFNANNDQSVYILAFEKNE